MAYTTRGLCLRTRTNVLFLSSSGRQIKPLHGGSPVGFDWLCVPCFINISKSYTKTNVSPTLAANFQFKPLPRSVTSSLSTTSGSALEIFTSNQPLRVGHVGLFITVPKPNCVEMLGSGYTSTSSSDNPRWDEVLNHTISSIVSQFSVSLIINI